MSKLMIIEVPSYSCEFKGIREVAELVRCGECKYRRNDGFCTRPLYSIEYQYMRADDFCSYGERSEKPNNCEHITEDGVTCAKYPACDDCLDNPLNKVKGSERLVKGSERSSE